MYIYRYLNGKYLWQISGLIPRHIRNALESKYEKVQRPIVTLMIVVAVGLLAVALFLNFRNERNQNFQLLASVAAMVLLYFAFYVGLLKDRHQKIRAQILDGTQGKHVFIREDDPVFKAIMAPALIERLSRLDEPISANARMELDSYLAEAQYRNEDDKRINLMLPPVELVDIRAHYHIEKAIIDAAESFSHPLEDTLNITFGDHFKERRQEVEQLLVQRVELFLRERKSKIKQYNKEIREIEGEGATTPPT